MRRRPFTFSALASCLFATALSLAAATTAAAQTMVGTVTERGTGRPLPGVFVVLEDSAGARAGGVLTGQDGGYVLRAGSPGRYRYSAELIGYSGATGGWVELGRGESVRQDIEVGVQAVTLDGIQVETGERCRRRPGSGPETARLWEEARKALELARWSEQQGVLRFQVVQHRRELDARTLRVEAQEETPRSGYADRSPYRSIPADRLHARGYVQQSPDGQYDYFAPDAEVLLSESFLDTHCFRVAKGLRDEPGLVGLAFEPVPERDQPDIRGVLWLERGTAELRRLDFTYDRLPFEHGDWTQVGGRVEFERLATGMWIVRRWWIRMPLVAARSGGFGGSRADLELITLSEEGAEVRSVAARDGTLIAEAVGATLYGTVTAAPSGPALAGATVEVLGTAHRTTTGDDGAYRIGGLPDGAYRVRASHPDLTLLGMSGPERDVRLVAGRAVQVPLAAGLAADRAAEWCATGRAVVVYGAVIGPDGETPVPGALIRLPDETPERRLLADSTGGFRLCVEPSERPVRLAAVEPGGALADASRLSPVEVVADAPGFLRADLPLSARPARVAAAGSRFRWSEAIVGRVVEEGTERAVEGATVALMDSLGGPPHQTVVTDERGAFSIAHPGRGSLFTLEVRHLGYSTVTSEVPFPEGQEVRLDVSVSARAIPIEPIVVTERRRDFLAVHGFYDRRERGMGIYVDREEVERRQPAKITDLLAGKPSVRLLQVGPMSYDIRVMGTERVSRDGLRPCQPAVYVDGLKVRGGGTPGPGNQAISDMVPTDLLGGIEVYTRPSQIPPQFGGAEAACGVVVLWTRNR